MQSCVKKIIICVNNGLQRELTTAGTIIIQFDVDKKEISESSIIKNIHGKQWIFMKIILVKWK